MQILSFYYMNRVIVASGEFNQVTRQWTESEAVAFALKAGKGWIDTQPAVKDLAKNNDR